jgi:putative SOS response-associated peptidase YedK
MCGRYTLRSRGSGKFYGVPASQLPLLVPRHNIAPSQSVVAVGDFGSGLEIANLSWGLIPSWSTDGKGFINARAETLEEKPSFSASFRLRRCLIPADGFFEAYRQGEAAFSILVQDWLWPILTK